MNDVDRLLNGEIRCARCQTWILDGAAFMTAQITDHETNEELQVAFCGGCWTVLQQLGSEARQKLLLKTVAKVKMGVSHGLFV